MANNLSLTFNLPIIPGNAGLFISPGYGIHPTRIIDSFELILVRSGNLGMFEGKKQFVLSAGDTLLLQPGRKHGGTENYPDKLSFYWIHFFLPKKHNPKRNNKSIISIPQQTHLDQPEKLIELYRHFLDEQESGHQSQTHATLIIMLMLQEAALGAGNKCTEDKYPLATKAKNYIAVNFEHNISTAKIAAALQCNPDYLGRIFKRNYGHSLTEEIHRKKINLAKKLLMDSILNIDEIASQCAFNDQVFFRRIFKRLTTTTPLAYRKRYSRVHINIK